MSKKELNKGDNKPNLNLVLSRDILRDFGET